jgi:ankyrin repeat protein
VRRVHFSGCANAHSLLALLHTSSSVSSMGRKKAQRKQETTLVPHRTPNLSVLLETAKTGDAAQAVKAYLDAGGSPVALTQWQAGQRLLQLPLLHRIAFRNAHSHRELAESVRLLIDAGADINATAAGPDGDERTALMCAAECECCIAVPHVLLQAGADPCVRSSPMCMTALDIAAAVGLAECCDLLLTRAHTLLEVKDDDGCTALMSAARDGRLANTQILLQHGADVNAVNYKGYSALIIAAQTTNTAVAQLLLDSGANLSATDTNCHNALFKAAQYGQVSMMALLVQRGLSVYAADSVGQTLLMRAANRGYKPAAKWLLRQGVDVNATDNEGYTALHSASVSDSCDDAAMIELLLASGADINQHTSDQYSALEGAARSGNVQCARVLIAASADVNHLNSMSVTNLHTAIICGHAEVVQLLLEHGAATVLNSVVVIKCMSQCCCSVTALMMCAKFDTVKLLLAAGADVHSATHAGDTCLHVAARHNWTAPMLCLVIKAGTDLHAVNSKGKTAAQLAHDQGYTLMEQLLNRAAQQKH